MNNTFSTNILCYKRLTFPVLFRGFGAGKYSYQNAFSKVFTDKLTSATKQFDNVLGIAEVRQAQSVVEKAEDEFMLSRRTVQDSGTELTRLQTQLRELRGKLDRIPREDERYLQLATEEHKVLIGERKLKLDLDGFVAVERDNFAALSAVVRNAHEKERSRAERTKYWSIIGSACGAVLGFLGSTIINVRRMKQIKLTVQENNQAFMADAMGEIKMIFQSDQNRLPPTSSDDKQDSTALVTNSQVISNENSEILSKINAKLEKLSNLTSLQSLASAIQELKQDLSEKRFVEVAGKCNSDVENSSSFLDFERSLHDVCWWTKASVAVSLASVSASLILYAFYR